MGMVTPGVARALAQGQPLRTLAPLANASAEPGLFSATLAAAPASLELVEGRPPRCGSTTAASRGR